MTIHFHLEGVRHRAFTTPNRLRLDAHRRLLNLLGLSLWRLLLVAHVVTLRSVGCVTLLILRARELRGCDGRHFLRDDFGGHGRLSAGEFVGRALGLSCGQNG
jgi:hypothetical protein